MARYLLDYPNTVRGLRVLDFGSGCGIAAIAAARAGATDVHASDIDGTARQAIAANAKANGIRVELCAEDLIGSTGHWDVILVADMWYERFLAMRLTAWLQQRASTGARVILADVGRAYFPRAEMRELARFALHSSCQLERGTTTSVGVWELKARGRQRGIFAPS